MVALWQWTRSGSALGPAGLLLGCGLAFAAGIATANAGQANVASSILDQALSVFSEGPADASPSPPAGTRANPLFPYAGTAEPQPGADYGVYRTVCVRLCDGYFWPVSNATEMMHFERDRNSCESSCEQPAQLYYERSGASGASKLVSLDGKPYSALPKAYSYRKSLEPECRCKPDPWSQSEVERHRQYTPTPDLAAAAETQAPLPTGLGSDAEPTPVADTDVQAGNPAAEAFTDYPGFEQKAVPGPDARSPAGAAAVRALQAGSNLDDDAFGSDIFTVRPVSPTPVSSGPARK